MEALKRVVLFGRTGDGKSTVANVLVTGGIDDVVFKFSDSASGCTTDIKTVSRRGWKVTDTLGVGEVSPATAKEDLTKLLTNFGESYSHIIYVQNANRKLTQLDELIWSLFEQIFAGAETAFVVLFTHASDELLDRNKDKLPQYMMRYPVLVTDIPPVGRKPQRPTFEMIQNRKRDRWMARLETDLMRIFADKNFQYATPDIARMTDKQLESKAESLWSLIVRKIKSMFEEPDWEIVAHRLWSIVDVARTFVHPNNTGYTREYDHDFPPEFPHAYRW